MTDDIHETPAASPDFRTELAAQLAELIPEAIADGKIDVEKLKELLDDDVADSTERFGLFWPGKKKALRAAQEPTTATLKPDFENSKDWGTTKNVFIEGDNLEVLKILQKHYHAKIKMIYIDPPYNTGKDFVYPDNYKEGLDTYLEWTRQVNEEGKKVSTNAETEGRYHSNWLNMMYPRLKLARNLLTDDGAIFVSIDDNEVDSLVRLMKELFGESNHLATIAWEKVHTRKNSSRFFSVQHEYVVAFARAKERWDRHLLPRTDDASKAYSNPDNDPKGPWKTDPITAHNYYSADYAITKPNGAVVRRPKDRYWVYSEATWQEKVSANAVIWGADASMPLVKRYLSEVQDGLVPVTLLSRTVAGDTATAKKEVDSLLGEGVFTDYPKPTSLIKQLLYTTTSGSDTVLDFFAGSATSLHAVMLANSEDGGSRRFIGVQLPEPVLPSSVAAGSGYLTIADLGRERSRRAGAGLRDLQDSGFRAFTLGASAFAAWQLSSEVDSDALAAHLFDLRDSTKDEATADDLLTEILLKQGYSLSETIKSDVIEGLDVRLVLDQDGDVAVLAYLDEHVKPTLAQLRALVDTEPTRIVVLEDVFQGDDELKTNLAQLATSRGIEFWTA